MWMVNKAYSWDSLGLDGLPQLRLAASSDIGERFIHVFNDYEKAKAFADKAGVGVTELKGA